MRRTSNQDIVIVVTQDDPEAYSWAKKVASCVVCYGPNSKSFDKITCLKHGVAEAVRLGATQCVLIDCDTVVSGELPDVPNEKIAFCESGDGDLTGLLYAPANELLMSLYMASGFKGWGAEDFWLRSAVMTMRKDTEPVTLDKSNFRAIRHTDRSWGVSCKYVSMFKNYANYIYLGERLFEHTGRCKRFFLSREHRAATGYRKPVERICEHLCNLYSKAL